MVVALSELDLAGRFVQTDERSAAFFALGLAKRLRRPVAICITSGSAVANVLPALSEAFAAGIALVVLSCDRPARLRGKGLPQTTEQVAICAPLVRAGLSLGDPSNSLSALERLAKRIDLVAGHLHPGSELGPIQINVPLLGEASSVEELPVIKPSPPVNTAPRPSPAPISVAPREHSGFGLRKGLRGAIVCGPDWDAALPPTLLRRLAHATGLPVLADAPGSARGLGIIGMLAEGDILSARPALPRPDFLIRIGGAPVSHTMQRFAAAVARIVRIDRQPIAEDFLATAFIDLPRPDAEAIDSLAEEAGLAPPGWLDEWRRLALATRSRFAPAIEAAGWCELQAVAEALDCDFSFLQASNSLAIRLVNMLCPVSDDGRLIFANRGVSGIDGNIGTFLGTLAADGGPGLLVVGDLATIHDVPALEACLHHDLHGVILVLNNSGAGLFDLLPLQSVPDYDRLVRNTVRVRFRGIAEAFGLTYRHCADRLSLRSLLLEAMATRGMMLIEAEVRPDIAKTTLPAFFREVLAA